MTEPVTPDPEQRKAWMGTLAKARPAELAALWTDAGTEPGFDWLRAPEIGGVMVRGRMGGTGQPFNLGETAVTRCALKLESGAVGHAYVQGRDKEKARIAAMVDALMQTDAAGEIEARILVPLRDAEAKRKTERAAKAAATKVDFFTLVRGED